MWGIENRGLVSNDKSRMLEIYKKTLYRPRSKRVSHSALRKSANETKYGRRIGD